MTPLRVAGVAAASFVACASSGIADDHDKQLARVNGNVAYQRGSDAALHALFGRIDLPDDATAITLAQSRAQLTLLDSSTIDIGATTRVRLGAFNAIVDVVARPCANPAAIDLSDGKIGAPGGDPTKAVRVNS